MRRQKLAASVSELLGNLRNPKISEREACSSPDANGPEIWWQLQRLHSRRCGVHIFVAATPISPPARPPAWRRPAGRSARPTGNLCADSAAFPASFDTNRRDTAGNVFKASLPPPLLLLDQSSLRRERARDAICKTRAVVVLRRSPRIVSKTIRSIDSRLRSFKTFQIVRGRARVPRRRYAGS